MLQPSSDYLNGNRGKRRIGVVSFLLFALCYMRRQVCARRQAHHHVYLKPLSGTDQTFALPASPRFPLFLSIPLSTLISFLLKRQHAAKHPQLSKTKQESEEDGGVCTCVSLLDCVCVCVCPVNDGK